MKYSIIIKQNGYQPSVSVRHGHLPTDQLLERDDALHPIHLQGLDTFPQNGEQMLVVQGVNLHEKVVRACRAMTLHHLRNLPQLRHNQVLVRMLPEP